MDRQSIYKSYKNKLNHSLRTAKRLYYEKKLNNVQSNTRANTRTTWKGKAAGYDQIPMTVIK